MRKLLLLALAGAAAWAADSCVDCHSKLEGAQQAPATAFTADIHRRAGFSCADCHGGDRSTSDMDASMSKARGFRGKIARKDVPQLCARCHSDANLIHKHKPQQRVDQYAQYQTSVHGKKLAAGDTAAANCVDCHSVHDIREVKNALSPVHPLRLPETCARCHADAAKMAKYKLDTHQFEQYRKSVHWEALAKRGDLSAPSCASCHGNHGAAPPQVSSVAAVCGTCHVLFEDLYKKSPHQPVFAAMGAGGCVVCHENHGIVKPSTEMLAGARSVCVQCHDAASAGGATAAKMAEQIGKLSTALDRSDGILRRARESGMEISEAQLKQIEGRENLIKARVAVHAFQVSAVEKPVNDGLAIAGETWKAGDSALKERDWRRVGLAAALVTILVTMTGLGLAIRSIERRPQAVDNPTGR
ncbi:MAG: cytochrome c3 family protein [Candidatus Solibacter usitatus]|nr:cytochrome c3 family protein [Candidatus Solibacter usitatus]